MSQFGSALDRTDENEGRTAPSPGFSREARSTQIEGKRRNDSAGSWEFADGRRRPLPPPFPATTHERPTLLRSLPLRPRAFSAELLGTPAYKSRGRSLQPRVPCHWTPDTGLRPCERPAPPTIGCGSPCGRSGPRSHGRRACGRSLQLWSPGRGCAGRRAAHGAPATRGGGHYPSLTGASRNPAGESTSPNSSAERLG
jgi:hypothetical protein